MEKNIVLIYGWGASFAKLKPLKEELEGLDWSVFIPRLPGFDLKPAKNVWGVENYSRYIFRKAKNVFKKEKFFVFGHSFGGRMAIRTCSLYPERLKGIILCASGGISRGSFIKRSIFFVLAKGGKTFLFIPPLANLFEKLLYKLAREHDYEKAQGVMKKVMRRGISEDLKKDVYKIRLPVLIFWGKLDKITPYKDALFLKKSIKGSKLISYWKEGHQLPYRKPKSLAREIDKWSTNLN